MNYLPLFLRLAERSVLLVGGGAVARRKLASLLDVGAQVDVVAREVDPETLSDAQARGATVEVRDFDAADVTGRAVVVAATNDEKTNRHIAAVCRDANVLVNVVDQPALCTVIFPAIVNRDPVLVAVSSGGTSPVLARVVRGWLERRLPARLGNLARLADGLRDVVKARLPDLSARRRFWESVLEGPIASLVYRGEQDAAKMALEKALASTSDVPMGRVALVGAGPGDPDLLTLRGLRCLEQADVVFYDNLVDERVLNLARRDAERIYVGKRRDFHAVRQEEINRLLIEHAQQGRFVVRLKGGDPFIFGRGGEEIGSLAEKGIPFEVIPGITAALGCASYAGIPLTHRDCAQSVRFVTGHRQGDHVNLDWPELAKPDQTLVIYMGLVGLEEICQQLISHGMSPSMPAALIARGTLDDQQVVTAPIEGLAAAVAAANVKGPTTIIIGHVVGLREKLDPTRR